MKLRVLELCKSQNIMQKELAEKIGVGPVGLSKAINGNPTMETLEKIASALGVEVVELFAPQEKHRLTCPSCGAQLRVEQITLPSPASSPASGTPD
jgi:transcriptional regulator with XRE-family HTH domain